MQLYNTCILHVLLVKISILFLFLYIIKITKEEHRVYKKKHEGVAPGI